MKEMHSTYPFWAAALASWPRASCSCNCEEDMAAAPVEETTDWAEVGHVVVVVPPALTVWAVGATTVCKEGKFCNSKRGQGNNKTYP